MHRNMPSLHTKGSQTSKSIMKPRWFAEPFHEPYSSTAYRYSYMYIHVACRRMERRKRQKKPTALTIPTWSPTVVLSQPEPA